MRSNPGRIVRAAFVVAVLVATGLAASGAQAASGKKVADVRLAYTCALPSGSRPVQVRISGVFPASGAVGRAIAPAGVRVEIVLPRTAATGLGAGSFAGVVALETAVTENGTRAGAPWPYLRVPPAPVPGIGDLVVNASAPVPAVTARAPGDVRFTAGRLNLLLAPLRSAGKPSSLKARCVPRGGRAALLATVPVAGRHGMVAPRSAAAPRDDGQPAPECQGFGQEPPSGYGCAWMTGFSNVKKLGGAALIQPAILDIAMWDPVPCDDTFTSFCFDLDAQLNYVPVPGKPGLRQFPPSDATFLTFGFMPTRATMDLLEVGLMHIKIVLNFNDYELSYAEATANMNIRLHDVLVNGRPLDVGPRCETVSPMRLTVRADLNHWGINDGGVLSGTSAIPPFGGCGVGENLDRLMTGSISGPDNFVKMTQGSLCTFPIIFGCPPQKPAPIA